MTGWEPIDGWYVFLGLAVASTLVAGVALELPTAPPPDADEFANTVDSVATSRYGAAATIDHDATAVKIGAESVSMQSPDGLSRATVTTGKLLPVWAVANQTRRESLQRILDGASPGAVLGENSTATLSVWYETTTQTLGPRDREWRPLEEKIRLRSVSGTRFTIVLVGSESQDRVQ